MVYGSFYAYLKAQEEEIFARVALNRQLLLLVTALQEARDNNMEELSLYLALEGVLNALDLCGQNLPEELWAWLYEG